MKVIKVLRRVGSYEPSPHLNISEVKINILMFGSREWTDYNKVLNIMQRLKAKYKDIIIIEENSKGSKDMRLMKHNIHCYIIKGA